jgi:hypothetical protein
LAVAGPARIATTPTTTAAITAAIASREAHPWRVVFQTVTAAVPSWCRGGHRRCGARVFDCICRKLTSCQPPAGADCQRPNTSGRHDECHHAQ